jgi:hypothetical protein
MRVLFSGLVGLVALSFAASSMAEGVVYKWEAEDGQLHYSDIPREGAVEVDLTPAQTFNRGRDARIAKNSAGAEGDKADSAAGYKSLRISSPSQEETIWNTGGVVTVRLSLSPVLKTGHSVRMFVDGRQLANLPSRLTSVKLTEVVRGSHTLRAEVRDSRDKVVIRSDQVTFFYKQQTAGNALQAVQTNPSKNVLPQKSQKNRPRPTPK